MPFQFLVEFGALGFVEVNGEISVERFGKRTGLSRAFGEKFFGDHRAENIVCLKTFFAQEFEVESRVVKDFRNMRIC